MESADSYEKKIADDVKWDHKSRPLKVSPEEKNPTKKE